MSEITEHYESLLAPHYSWIMGGREENIQKNHAFFKERGFTPKADGHAVDLGAGNGFQSIPLVRQGYSVTAVDLSPSLLKELDEHSEGAGIRTVTGDIRDFAAHLDGPAELIVCMGDTLAHLPAMIDIEGLFAAVKNSLEPGGDFVLSFRDQSCALEGTDRFIPMRSEDDRIFTCFVEYGPESIMVHDLLHIKENGAWTLHKSSYRKLRLTDELIAETLEKAGFEITESQMERGFVTVTTRG